MKQKNKGGRPRSSRVQKKSRAVTVRYSALQYDIVRHRARTAGFRTLTEYVREASVNAEVVQNFIQEHNAVFRDLSGLLSNIGSTTKKYVLIGFSKHHRLIFLNTLRLVNLEYSC